MNVRHIMLALILCTGLTPLAAFPESTEHDAHHVASPAGAANALSTGEVRKVDLEGKKITIRHGPLDNLGMPAMTMVFRVDDAALLGNVKAGDKVRFRAENRGNALVVTRLQAQ